MTKHEAPSFQFYPKDFLSDPDVMQMNMAQKGAYITLLSFQWLNDGLPNNDSYIRNLLGATPKWKSLWEGIRHKFVEIDGKLYNKRLYKEKQKQIDHRQAASKAGKKGAEVRWNNDSNPIKTPIAKNSFSSSSSFSSSTSNNIKINKNELDELYELLIDNDKELERWKRTGKMFPYMIESSLLKYLKSVGDFDTAKIYAEERNKRKKEGVFVPKLENFCKGNWVEFAPEEKKNVFRDLESESV